jgi:hypothetical protein
MNVFLVPMGGDHYELYCEPVQAAPPDDVSQGSRLWRAPRRWWAWAVGVFRRAVAEGEAERDQPAEAGAEAVPRSKIRRTITRKLAEAVAEQRLLWHLRKETAARLYHPDVLAGDTALQMARAEIKRDHDKHRLWCVIDALLTIASAPIALLPGPNVLAYYFIFRTVGHYLSMAGARQGLDRVDWQLQPSAELTALGQALPCETDDRTARIDAIASALGLDRLTAFVERAAFRS